jgi:phosphatidylglycerophosphatase A
MVPRIRILSITSLIALMSCLIQLVEALTHIAALVRMRLIDCLAYLYCTRNIASQERDDDKAGRLGDEVLGIAMVLIIAGLIASSLCPEQSNDMLIASVLQK